MDMVEWKHRGRIQAQGGGVEESVAWAQIDPPAESEGHSMLERLNSKLPREAQRTRKQALAQAHRFVEEAARGGGIGSPVRKTFLVSPRTPRNERIDIEVQKGIAFVPDVVPTAKAR